MKQEISIKVDIPEGYEATGEYRPVKEEEYFLTGAGEPVKTPIEILNPYIILRKKKRKVIVFVPDAAGKYCSKRGSEFLWHGSHTSFCDRPRYRREEREKA